MTSNYDNTLYSQMSDCAKMAGKEVKLLIVIPCSFQQIILCCSWLMLARLAFASLLGLYAFYRYSATFAGKQLIL